MQPTAVLVSARPNVVYSPTKNGLLLYLLVGLLKESRFKSYFILRSSRCFPCVTFFKTKRDGISLVFSSLPVFAISGFFGFLRFGAMHSLSFTSARCFVVDNFGMYQP